MVGVRASNIGFTLTIKRLKQKAEAHVHTKRKGDPD